MSKDITIGDITVKAGEVKRCKINIGSDLYMNERGIPVIVYNGVKDGPCLYPKDRFPCSC